MNNLMLLSPGDKFEKYIIEKELGHGGMGAVYLVRHSILDTKFALKVLYPEVAGRNKQFVERFIREGRLAGQIRHDNLIAVYDAGQNEKNGMYYLVMDYVSGGSVRDRIKKNGYVDMLEAISIVRQVASALQAAQNHNMVHRDIKPDNIMFDDKGMVRLADLGIAKATDGRDTGLTMESSVFGTPAYMSPEQARDSSKVDTRADIYSLGVVFYEMLTGRRPFGGDTTIEILTKVIDNSPAPDVRTFSKNLPEDVAKLVSDMLEKDRNKRVKSPTELIKRIDALDLSAYQGGTQEPAEEVEVTMPTMSSPVAAPNETVSTVATLATAVDAKSVPNSAEPPASRGDAPAPSGADVTMPTMASPAPLGDASAPSGADVTMPTMASPAPLGDTPAPSGADVTMPTMASPAPLGDTPAPLGDTPAPSGADVTMPTMASPAPLGDAPAPSGADAPQQTMAMDGPAPQGNAAPAKPVKGGKGGGLIVILALFAVVGFMVVAGVGTVLFLKRDAIIAKIKKPEVVEPAKPQSVEPDAPQPVEPVVQQPVEPAKPQPVEPDAPQPVEPVVQQPVEPIVQPDAPQPVEPVVQPDAPQPVEPVVQPDAPQPVEPVVQQPVQPDAPQPVEPVVQPDAPQPVEPVVQPDAPQPVEPVVQPDAPQPVEPVVQPDAPQPVEPVVQPDAPQPVEPVVQQPVEPVVQQPVEPVVQQPVEPVVQQAVQPDAPQPVEPVVQQPVQPDAPQPVEPVVQQPVQPDAPQPVEPVVQQAVQPDAPQPVEPVVQQAVQPDAPQPVEPVVQQPLEPAVQQPVQPDAPQPVQQDAPQPVEPVVQHWLQDAIEGANGLRRLGSFKAGGVVLFGADEDPNSSIFKELSKCKEFKAVGFQEASKNVKDWSKQFNEIKDTGSAFVIITISAVKNDYQFKNMMKELTKTFTFKNVAVILNTTNNNVAGYVKEQCKYKGMYCEPWESPEDLLEYVLGMKEEFKW